MRKYLYLIPALLFAGLFLCAKKEIPADTRFVAYTANPQKQDIQLYWKDDRDELFRSIGRLKDWLGQRHRRLLFAMNGGMYTKENVPQGLFIQQGKLLAPLDDHDGNGNFYLKPNGIFWINKKRHAFVTKTTDFKFSGEAVFATQSGPMLVIDGTIHPSFKKGSANLNIRNGGGILPNGNVLFAMSKKEISLYDFADFFRKQGCKNALYLDGFVSRTYLPEQDWLQMDGNFGVIIGITGRY